MSKSKFTLEMVQRAIQYFADKNSVNEHDLASMTDFLKDFIQFETVVANGMVEADANKLASDFLVYARDWLKKNNFEQLYFELKK